MNTNNKLNKAKKLKNDEFFTRMVDIEKELIHYYPEQFYNKTILLNCNDSLDSNFWKYFYQNFNRLKLKKLIGISYGSYAKAYEYNGKDLKVTDLLFHGLFDSFESIQYLQQADIVITNPPFSLFRDFFKLVMSYNKKFLVIGPYMAVKYKHVFPYIKDKKIWLGVNIVEYFETSKSNKQRAFGCWFTNLEHDYTPEKLVLTKNYSPKEYPKFDNYDAINVKKVADIPKNYYDEIGVSVRFLLKWNPKQFELLGQLNSTVVDNYNFGQAIVNGKSEWVRFIIKRKFML